MNRVWLVPGGLSVCLALSTSAFAQLESTYQHIPADDEKQSGGLVEGQTGVIPPSPSPVTPGVPAAAPEAAQYSPGLANKGDLVSSPRVSTPQTNEEISASQQDVNTPPGGDDSDYQHEGFDVYTRGPLHEAFATPGDAIQKANPVVNKQPPEPINEVAPEQMPEGDNVVWIPGSWAYDQDLDDYLWVSGLWRDVPEGRKWVPGYWTQVDGGYQWIPGMWMGQDVSEIAYYPEPPETLENGPSSPAPGDNYFYVPGNWQYVDNNYQWSPGFWDQYRDNYVWVNSCYTYTPAGYVYNQGYWDYGLANRGLIYAPIRFNQGWGGGVYRPRILLNSGSNLLVNLFLRPGYNQYAFGNYYGPRYTNMGYQPWYGPSYFGGGGGRYRYNPLFSYYNYQYGGNYFNRLNQWNNYYTRNPNFAPRNTWREQQNFLRTARQDQNIDRAVIQNSAVALDMNNRDALQNLGINNDRPIRLRQTDENRIKNTSQAWNDVTKQRRDFEAKGVGRPGNQVERREALKINFPDELQRQQTPGNNVRNNRADQQTDLKNTENRGNRLDRENAPRNNAANDNAARENTRRDNAGKDDAAKGDAVKNNAQNRGKRELNDAVPLPPGATDDTPNKGQNPRDNNNPNEPNQPRRPGRPDNDQPGSQPNRPDQPNRPQASPDQPKMPDQPNRPDRPGRGEPGTQPQNPDQPRRPGQQPDQPNRPQTAPDQPKMPDQPKRPDRPDRGAPGTQPQKPDQPKRSPQPENVKPNPPPKQPATQPKVDPPKRPSPAAQPPRPQNVNPGKAGGGQPKGGGQPSADRGGNRGGGQPAAGGGGRGNRGGGQPAAGGGTKGGGGGGKRGGGEGGKKGGNS